MAEAHKRARKVLEAERDMLDTLAYPLLKKETAAVDERRAIMDAGRQQARVHEIGTRVLRYLDINEKV
jgi:ATP-dependent Zn protease